MTNVISSIMTKHDNEEEEDVLLRLLLCLKKVTRPESISIYERTTHAAWNAVKTHCR